MLRKFVFQLWSFRSVPSDLLQSPVLLELSNAIHVSVRLCYHLIAGLVNRPRAASCKPTRKGFRNVCSPVSKAHTPIPQEKGIDEDKFDPNNKTPVWVYLLLRRPPCANNSFLNCYFNFDLLLSFTHGLWRTERTLIWSGNRLTLSFLRYARHRKWGMTWNAKPYIHLLVPFCFHSTWILCHFSHLFGPHRTVSPCIFSRLNPRASGSIPVS